MEICKKTNEARPFSHFLASPIRKPITINIQSPYIRMLSTDFAPNENRQSAFAALHILFAPWQYHRGKHLTRLRTRMKKYLPKSDFYFFISGRVALYKALEVLELQKNDEVIVTAFTCEAVVIPAQAHGLKLRFADIDPYTYTMSPETIEPLINKRTKVLVLQHTYGICPARTQIIALCRKHNITVIEDLAHGWQIKELQRSSYRTIKMFSFGRSKALSSIYGGALAVTGPTLGEKLKRCEKTMRMPSAFFIMRALLYVPLATLSKHLYGVGIGRITLGKLIHRLIKLTRLIPNELSAKEKQLKWDMQGNLGYPNALAHLLLKALPIFDRNRAKRLSACAIYDHKSLPDRPYKAALSRYPIRVRNPDKVASSLAKKNIYVGRWYRRIQGSRHKDTPVAAQTSSQIINLPTLVTKSQAKEILRQIDQICQKE